MMCGETWLSLETFSWAMARKDLSYTQLSDNLRVYSSIQRPILSVIYRTVVAELNVGNSVSKDSPRKRYPVPRVLVAMSVV